MEKQKAARINYICQFINLPSSKFVSFNNYIHFDEKWVYVNKINKKVYLGPTETIQTRKKQIKNMTKVMFLGAVANTRMDYKRGKFFNGKVGCYPLMEDIQDKRNRKNRNKSQTYLSSIISVTKEVVKKVIIQKLIPSIVEVFPRDTITIIIQLDGSSAHNVDDDMDLFWEITERNLSTKLEKQPPQSPDLNVLNLGYFTSIQGLQHKKYFKDVKELVKTVI